MSGRPTGARLVKGTATIDIVKMVRHARKQRAFPALRPDAEALLNERILATEWYSHDTFLVLIQFAFDQLLARSERRAIEMGAAGGRAQLLGPHRAFVHSEDPLANAWAMRHLWRLTFNFGELRAERDVQGMRFLLSGYEDVPPAHAFMIAGWLRAGAQLSSPSATVTLLERPWEGAATLTLLVTLGVD